MRSVLRGRQNDVELWRSEARSEILRSLAREFRTVLWTTRLFEVLLEELHLDEELERLLGERIPDLNRSRYAEAIAIGLILRHSWHPKRPCRHSGTLGRSCQTAESEHHCGPPGAARQRKFSTRDAAAPRGRDYAGWESRRSKSRSPQVIEGARRCERFEWSDRLARHL
jgi:hypothetical protein